MLTEEEPSLARTGPRLTALLLTPLVGSVSHFVLWMISSVAHAFLAKSLVAKQKVYHHLFDHIVTSEVVANWPHAIDTELAIAKARYSMSPRPPRGKPLKSRWR